MREVHRGSDEPETLEHGRPVRQPSRRRAMLTRLVVAVLVVAALAALAVDLQVRGRESARVEACLTAGEAAVRTSSAREATIARYLQPALQTSSSPALRTGLLALISDQVRPTLPAVRRARDRCADTGVLWFHDSLRSARDACLGLLDAELAHLREVTSNGAVAFVTRDRVGRCG